MDTNIPRITRFLTADGKVQQLPSKRQTLLAVLEYLASKFEANRNYSEKEVNAILTQWHTFGDFYVLRRSLIDYGLLSRTTDCSRYWLLEQQKEKL